jgi:choline dehydrogenase
MVSISVSPLGALFALVSAQQGRLYSSSFAIPGNASYDYVGMCHSYKFNARLF